jgi:glycosyltransferase involved in cell wall biosynthesis
MKIVIVETDARGGLIHFSYQLAEALASAGAETVLLTGRDYELAALPHKTRVLPILKFWPQFEEAGASPLQLRLRRAMRPVRRIWRGFVTLREWSRLTLWLLRNPPDVVFFSIIRFPFQVMFLRILRRAGIPLVDICHEFERREAKSRAKPGLNARLYSAAFRQFSLILFVSEQTRKEFLQTFGPIVPTHSIPHGPQLLFGQDARDAVALQKERYSLSASDRVVLFIGGLRPSKGVPELIEAFARLPDRAGLRLVIAGYPSREFDTEAIEDQVRKLDLSDQVRLRFEYVPNEEIGAVVQMADVVVFPYRSATASGAVALAQTLRRPIVATSVGGLREAIEDGVTGRLVPPGDVPALAGAIQDILSNPEEAARMAEAAFDAATRERSWEEIARRIRAILEEERITDRKASRRADQDAKGKPK